MSNLCSTLREVLEHECMQEAESTTRHDQEPAGAKRARPHDGVVGVRYQGPCESREKCGLLLDAGGSPRHRVVSDGDLVQHVMSMLAGPSRASREDVGRLSLVCLLWRYVGRREAIWRPISMHLLPVIEQQGGRAVVGIEEGVHHRDYLQSYGRALVERRVFDEPLRGVDLHVEFRDEMDGVMMCSAVGAAALDFDEDLGVTLLQHRGGLIGASCLTAADRDPQQHRYANFEEFLRRAHEADMLSGLRLRVVVRGPQLAEDGAALGVGERSAAHP